MTFLRSTLTLGALVLPVAAPAAEMTCAQLGTYLAMFTVMALAMGFGFRSWFGRFALWGFPDAPDRKLLTSGDDKK